MGLILATLSAFALTLSAADLLQSNSAPDKILLLDNLGRIVQVPTNEISRKLQPPAGIGVKRQTPNPVEGIKVPGEILQRMEAGREDEKGIQFFPAVQPRLMPYLASFDEHGNTALRPGALTPFVPLDALVQGGKYALSAYGLRYALQQTFTYVNMTDVKEGDNSLGFYTFDLKAKWAIFDAPSLNKQSRQH